jgi:hypothetical protein
MDDMVWHARTFRVPGHAHCYAVCGSSALKDAIYTLSKTLIFTHAKGQMNYGLNELDLVYRVMRAQLSGVRNGLGWNRTINLRLPERAVDVASTLAAIAEVFVVLHEMVHIVSGDLEDDIPAGNLEGTSPQTTEMRRKWLALDPINRERACDMLALDALAAAPLPDWDPAWCAVGVELALATQSMLEMATWWIRPSSHSPFRERFSFLEWSYKQTKGKELREGGRGLFPWIRPIELADLFSQAGWLGPYSDSLGDAIAGHRDIFDLEDPDEQVRRFYDPMDLFDQYVRSPAPGLYRSIYIEMFPEPDDRWKDILQIVPRPEDEDLHSVFSDMESDPFADGSYDADSYWAAAIGGRAIFVGYVLPKLLDAGLFRAGTSFATLANVIRRETSSRSLVTVAALLIQLRAGVSTSFVFSDPVVEDILRICELSAPQA